MAKIAIIGSGIAGLTAGWLLQQAGHQITLYERQAQVGMDAHAVEIEVDGMVGRVDVPLRGFNPENWRNLVGLCQAVGVETQEVDLGHSFNELDGTTIFSYQRVDLQNLYGSLLRNKRLLSRTTTQILAEVFRFKQHAKPDMAQPHLAAMTLKEYLAYRDYAPTFVFQYMYPALATICTCSYAYLDAYPMTVIVEFLENMLGRFNLRRVQGGTQTIVQKLLTGITEFRGQTTVTSVYPTANGAAIRTDKGDETHYDQVIIATQANHAWPLLSAELTIERELLQNFSQDALTVMIHRDSRFMPQRRTDWAMINFMSQSDAAMSTIWLNCLEPTWADKTPVFQTTNPLFQPIKESMLTTIYFERAVVTHTSQRALAELETLQLQPNRHIWFCGSYASHGIPLLESAVNSCVKVAAQLGVACPWR
jgi:predicted NAD/FAD-binding protein